MIWQFALTARLTINSRLCNCCWRRSSEILGRFNLCHLQCIRLQKLRYFNLSGQTNRLPVYKVALLTLSNTQVALLTLSNTQRFQIFTSLITVLNTAFSATTARLWRVTISFITSVCPSVCQQGTTWFPMEFHEILCFRIFENLLIKLKCDCSLMRIKGTLHEDM
jgi:hypothetical protein